MKTYPFPVALRQFLVAACGLGFFSTCLAATSPATRPALQQLSEESRNLYEHIQHQAVRVEMPAPDWMMELAQRENPLAKWGQLLDAQVRRQLAEQAQRLSAEVTPTNHPATQPSSNSAMHLEFVPNAADQANHGIIIAVRPVDHAHAAPLTGKVNTLGLILDDQGHVLIPLYIEKQAANRGPITLYNADGITQAKFVGSDMKTGLTVVQMQKIIGSAADLSDDKPDIGSLVMILAPNQSAAHIDLWTGATADSGIVAGMDGQILGISRMGQLLSPREFDPITRQLIATGIVRRALLGVKIIEVPPDNPQRQSSSILGDRPALEVTEVLPASAADRAGIHVGDLILTLAGQNVEDRFAFATAIAERSGPTDLQILREGQIIQTRVNLVAK